MASDQLDGARLKIARAKQHLQSFNDEGSQYVGSEPYEVVTELDGDFIRVRGVITAEPPPTLACIVGDFVTNLRASLDYVAWELAMRAGRTLTGGEKRNVKFPIAPDKKAFNKADGTAERLAKTCGVSAAAISAIESVQPYNSGYEPLRALDELVNRDKHRTLLLCGGFVDSAGAISIYHRGQRAWTAVGMTGLEMNLAAFDPPLGPATDFDVRIDAPPTMYVSLKDFPSPGETSWVGILQQIYECVEKIVPRFEQFF
jgi:hypothetical protein